LQVEGHADHPPSSVWDQYGRARSIDLGGPTLKTMSISIRPADLESDRAALLELFQRQLRAQMGTARYDWLYCEGPHGKARAWVAIEDSTGRIVGAGAAFPRRMYFDGSINNGFVLGDFCIEEKYRSLGPSLMLQKACLSAIDEGPFRFVYDFPSASMMAVYRRLGVPSSGSLIRWARPLRVGQKLSQGLGRGWPVRIVARVIDAGLALRGRRGGTAYDHQIYEGLFGPEFTLLDSLVRQRNGIQTSRTAEYLNWRYRSNPLGHFKCITARKAGKLIGYAIYEYEPPLGSIADICAVDEPEVVESLLCEAVERLRILGAATVNLAAVSAHPWSNAFHRAGFRRREASPVMVKTVPGSAMSTATFLSHWFAMRGERDS